MNTLTQDLHLGCRRLRRYPTAAAAAIMTLALGIGACTAIFSIVDAVLLRPLPYADAGELVTLWETHPRQVGGYRVASLPAADAWRSELDELDELAVSRPWRPVLSRDAELLSLEGAKVSANFFPLLGVEPMLGRAFLPADTEPGASPMVLISHRLWQLRFGGDDHLVGAQILLEGAPERVLATVAGVLPPGLRIDQPLVHQSAEIFAPLTDDETSNHFGKRYYRVVGRLAEGAKIETARAHLNSIAGYLARSQPTTNGDWRASMERLREHLAEPIRPALLALLAGVALVFLVACCNVGILLMSQASARRRELAVRLALGAGGWRVGRQILTECLLLASASGLLGLWLAHHGVALMTAYLTDALPPSQAVTIDYRALLFAFVLALLTVLLFGLAPALRIGKLNVQATLAARGRRSCSGPAGPRHALVAAELALSSILLVAAALLIGSFQRLATSDRGFEPHGVTTMRLRAVAPIDHGETHPGLLYESLLAEAARIPGVDSAGLINRPPLPGSDMSSRATAATRPEEPLQVEFRGVTSRYFDTLGIPLIEQHDLAQLDRDGGEQDVVVISETAAQRLWPGEQALGRRLVLEWGSSHSREVIGVVGDVGHPTAPNTVQPTVYLPFRQTPHRSMTLVLRGQSTTDLFAAVRARARSLGSPLVVEQPEDFSQAVAAAIAEPRARALLVTAFALTAMLLAAGGTYSAVSLSVEQRRYDSSVRQALGAHPRLLVRDTIAEMLRHGSLGIALGLAISLLLAKALSGLFYGVDLRDPRILLSTAMVMTFIVGISSYLPARRLSNADPAAALRAE